jgi:DNA polymerase
MVAVHLDYETFSTVDLPRAGLWSYAHSPATDILCLGWAINDEEPQLWLPGQPIPFKLHDALLHGRLLAFNANFERAITECVGTRYGMAKPKLSQWEDTQAIARMCAFPGSLAKCAKALGLEQQKDPDGARLIRFFSMPQRDGSRNLPKDNPHEFKAFCRYCLQDVRVDRAIHGALPVQSLPPFERRVWQIDSIINERGVFIDVAMARGAEALVSRAKATAAESLARMTDGEITGPGQAKRILALADRLGAPLPNLQKPSVAEALANENLPDLLRDVLELRSISNLSSVAKYKAMLKAVEKDGRIRGVHMYHSATTGRWGGRLVQFQNLPRPSVKLNEFDHDCIRRGDAKTLELLYLNLLPVLRDAIRNVVRAPKGRQLFVVDKASIEARVLGWLADAKGYLKAYKAGRDLYRVLAAEIFHVAYEDVTEEQRRMGKYGILGLGYGAWADTFIGICKNIGGVDVSQSLAEQTVHTYRDLFSEIPAYWQRVEHDCIAVIRSGQPKTLPHDIRIAMDGPHLTIRLPSGRKLWFPHATIKQAMNKWGKLKDSIRFMTDAHNQWMEVATYGGRLVENIDQAISRDLLANALLECEDAGLRPVMHVHDEIVGEPDMTHKLDEMHSIFRKPPSWTPGLPLDSSGFAGPYYRKA